MGDGHWVKKLVFKHGIVHLGNYFFEFCYVGNIQSNISKMCYHTDFKKSMTNVMFLGSAINPEVTFKVLPRAMMTFGLFNINYLIFFNF